MSGAAQFAGDRLPVKFVNSLRTLFDILDEYGRGVIHIDSLERHWQALATSQDALPRNVIGIWRNLAQPANGELDFARFLAGIEQALSVNANNGDQRNDAVLSKAARDRVLRQSSSAANVLATSTQGFQTSSLQNRAMSLSHLPDTRHNGRIESSPPNMEGWWATGASEPTRASVAPDQRASVASMSALDRYPPANRAAGVGDARNPSQNGPGVGHNGPQHRGPHRQNQPARRHTVTSGVDYQTMRRLKLLEDQKAAYNQGLDTVRRAGSWLSKQLAQVSHHLAAGESAPSHDFDHDFSAALTRKIHETNHQLLVLIDSTQRGDIRMLTTTSPTRESQTTIDAYSSQIQEQNNIINKLRSQLKQISQELAQKSERIGQLEHEKAQLIKEMFEASSKHRQHVTYEDASYI